MKKQQVQVKVIQLGPEEALAEAVNEFLASKGEAVISTSFPSLATCYITYWEDVE